MLNSWAPRLASPWLTATCLPVADLLRLKSGWVSVPSGLMYIIIEGTVVRHQSYCDDFEGLADSSEQTQLLATAISEWCKAWGMEANISVGKTEVLYVPPKGSSPPASLPHIYWPAPGPNAEPISYTTRYRYLVSRLAHLRVEEVAPVAEDHCAAVVAQDRKFESVVERLLERGDVEVR
jgi:hypothetical protein